MNAVPRHDLLRERIANGAALLALLVLGVLATFGPSGLLAWSEDSARLEQHQARILALREDVGALENRVRLLDPAAVDPDLSSELIRRDLNVAHEEEYVIELVPQE